MLKPDSQPDQKLMLKPDPNKIISDPKHGINDDFYVPYLLYGGYYSWD